MKIKLITHTPNPELVVATSAKLCYSPSSIDDLMDKQTPENIEKFLNRLADLGHCYDKDTEVLTSEGFIRWPDITYEHKIASFNPDDASFNKFEKPSKIYSRHICEDLIEFTHKRASLLVTKEHRLYCSLSNRSFKRNNPNFEILRANEYVQYNNKKVYETPLRMKSCAINKNTEVKAEDTIYKLYGFFIGDGYVRDNKSENANSIYFHLKMDRKINYLKNICKETGFDLIENKNNSFVVKVPNAKLFRDMFYNENSDKTFPNKFYNMSSNQYNNFIEGLLNSDGHYAGRGKNDEYSSSSFELCEKIQTLSSINNRFTTITRANDNLYRVYIGKDRFSSPMFNDSRNDNCGKLTKYEGNVYCATVSTGLLMIRRNGFTLLCGNCSPLEHISFTFAIEGVSRALTHQLVRHRIASYSQQSQRYVKEKLFEYITPDEIAIDGDLSNMYSNFMNDVQDMYDAIVVRLTNKYINCGMNKRDAEKKAIENARYVLPNACETKIMVTMNARTLLNFFKERCCMRAQDEIREMAWLMLNEVQEVAPIIFKNAGASCLNGTCKEGPMCCGKPYKENPVLKLNGKFVYKYEDLNND